MCTRSCVLALALGMVGLPAAVADQESSLAVSLPQDSELTYQRKTDNLDAIFFRGDVVQTGLLLAYWELEYPESGPLADSEPLRHLNFRFYPDQSAEQTLPSLGYRTQSQLSSPDRIFIYHTVTEHSSWVDFVAEFDPSAAATSNLLATFEELSPGFLEQEEGKAIQPVTVTLSGLASFVDAAHIFTYGQIKAVDALSMSDYVLSRIVDAQPGNYLSRPWEYRLWVPEDSALYQQPDGARLADVPAGTSALIRLDSAQDGWVKVQYRDRDSETELTGYMDAREVQPVN